MISLCYDPTANRFIVGVLKAKDLPTVDLTHSVGEFLFLFCYSIWVYTYMNNMSMWEKEIIIFGYLTTYLIGHTVTQYNLNHGL